MSDALRCYGDEQRLVVRRHVPACPGRPCRGCQPCEERHCDLCGKEHADNVCGGCLTRIRDNLAAIVELYAMLPHQAMYAGSDGRLEASRPIPGGEAMVMLGPMSDGLSLPDYDEWITVDDEHPLHILATWVDCWREWWGRPTDLRATIAREAAWINEQLDEMVKAPPDEPWFPPDLGEMARDIAGSRAALERVLHDEQGGYRAAPCAKCRTKLIRDVADRRHVNVCRGHGHLTVCPLPRHAGCADSGGAVDGWKCPGCGESYTVAEYETMVARDHLDNATALCGEDIERRTGVKAGTVRVWASRGKVRKRGKDDKGRTLYEVDDVLVHYQPTTEEVEA